MMKNLIVLVIICVLLIILKYVVSGGYYDYHLQRQQFFETQAEIIDDNKRTIAAIEYYRSANYLFGYKEMLEMRELTPDKSIIMNSVTVPPKNIEDEE